jgi:hypothetical protein
MEALRAVTVYVFEMCLYTVYNLYSFINYIADFETVLWKQVIIIVIKLF